jgi:hypothetical protein
MQNVEFRYVLIDPLRSQGTFTLRFLPRTRETCHFLNTRLVLYQEGKCLLPCGGSIPSTVGAV